MNGSSGGERDSLAPVIPLFGGPAPVRPDADERPTASAVREHDSDEPTPDSAARVQDDSAGVQESADLGWHPTWASDRARHEPESGDGDRARPSSDLAEKALLKKLRTRSLSVSEARAVLREYELDEASAEGVLASMAEYGYLDDAALAEQLVHAGVDRRGQGRQLIAQTLAKRGIPRDVVDAALADLPDDDLERALEFARGKARSMRDLDRDVALRRLTGQLARRGYGGSLAMTAARIALEERPTGSSGVRFR